jgi:nicotinamidase-related amidase
MAGFPQDTALMIIDVQQGFTDSSWGNRNNPQAEENITKLLEAWRVSKRPIFHVQHLSTNPESPLRPGQPGCEIQATVKPQPGEPIIQKNVNSAFIGTDLQERLQQNTIKTLVITGLTTNHCVSTTARMAGNLGFDTYVVSDATATFDRVDHEGISYTAAEVHAISLANLHQEFATIIDTENLLAQINS